MLLIKKTSQIQWKKPQAQIPPRISPMSLTSIISPTPSYPPETPGGWFNHVYRLNQVIQKMSNRGLPIDKIALDTLGVELDKEKLRLQQEIKALIVSREEVKGTSFWGYKTEDNYKVLPKVLREECKLRGSEVTEVKRRKNKETGKFEKLEVTELVPAPYCIEGFKYPCPMTAYEDWFKEFAVEAGFEWQLDGDIGVLVAKESFNPASPAQLKDYCYWMNYSIPVTMKKTPKGREEKESTDDKALEELILQTKDEMFSLIQDFREVNKLRTTYCGKPQIDGSVVGGWQPKSTGRLHPVFKFTTATGQLASENPNAQNLPKGGTYGDKIRSCVKATSGKLILEVDYSGYHALMLGYFAEDPGYMRLSRYGIHDFLAAYMLRGIIARMKPKELETELWQETITRLETLDNWLNLDDAALKGNLKWVKTNHKTLRDKKAKPIAHSMGFGSGVRGIYEKNKSSFSGEKEVKVIRDLYYQLFPKIKLFQDKIILKAHNDKRLINPYGRVRRFWEAMVWDSRNRGLKKGDEAEAAVAFLPASTAFAVKTEALLRLETLGANEKFNYILDVHDSGIWEIDERDLKEAYHVITGEMARPVKRLAHPKLCPDGLVCDLEASVAVDWGNMKEIKF